MQPNFRKMTVTLRQVSVLRIVLRYEKLFSVLEFAHTPKEDLEGAPFAAYVKHNNFVTAVDLSLAEAERRVVEKAGMNPAATVNLTMAPVQMLLFEECFRRLGDGTYRLLPALGGVDEQRNFLDVSRGEAPALLQKLETAIEVTPDGTPLESIGITQNMPKEKQ